jgi:hypothetical protein
LSKSLKLQQENEDKKNDFSINNLEKKIENLENSLKEKDSLLNIAECSLSLSLKLVFEMRNKAIKFQIKTRELKG